MRGNAWLGLGALLLLALATTKAVMQIKPGVDTGDFIPAPTLKILDAVSTAWGTYGFSPMLTSLWRNSPGSLHAVGLAADFRTADIASGLVFNLAAEASRILGPEFEAIVEDGTERWYYRGGVFQGHMADQGEAAPHIHVEYDQPRET